MATTSRVSAGLRSSKVFPLADSTHSPLTKFLNILVVVVPPAITGLVRVSVAIEPPENDCRTSMLTTGMKTGKRAGAECNARLDSGRECVTGYCCGQR